MISVTVSVQSNSPQGLTDVANRLMESVDKYNAFQTRLAAQMEPQGELAEIERVGTLAAKTRIEIKVVY